MNSYVLKFFTQSWVRKNRLFFCLYSSVQQEEGGMTKGLKELPKTSRGRSQRGCGQRTEGLILSGEGEQTNSNPNTMVCPTVLIQSPHTPKDLPWGHTCRGFKESWTNPSILPSWPISESSIKHQQGSLCQASLPCAAWDRQGRAGGLENTDCHLLCQFSCAIKRLHRENPGVMTCTAARATSQG